MVFRKNNKEKNGNSRLTVGNFRFIGMTNIPVNRVMTYKN